MVVKALFPACELLFKLLFVIRNRIYFKPGAFLALAHPVAGVLQLLIQIIEFVLECFYSFEDFSSLAAFLVRVARHYLTFTEALLEDLLHSGSSSLCADVGVHTSDKNGMFCDEPLDKLISRGELGIAHFITETDQKTVSDERVDQG
jgi:hypothetical protein